MRSAESAVGERPKSVVSRAVDIASREIEQVEAHKRDVPRARRKKIADKAMKGVEDLY